MSTMYVNEVNELNVGNGVNIPGHIIGYYTVDWPNHLQVGSSTPWTDMLSSQAITPKSAASRFMFMVTGHTRMGGGSASRHMFGVRIIRDINNGASRTVINNSVGSMESLHISGPSVAEIDTSIARQGIDHPNTTDPVKYIISMRGNTSFTNAGYIFSGQFGSNFTILELGG